MEERHKQIVTHFVLALLLFPLYQFGGEPLKLLLLPYVIYMLWSKNPVYLPALFIHFTPGSTVSLMMLVTIIAMCFRDFELIKRNKLAWLFYLLLLLMPLFLTYFIINFFARGKSFGLSLEYISFYLGFFSLFYGLIIAPRVDGLVWRYIVICLFIFPLFSIIPTFGIVRTYWLSFPLFVGIFLMYVFGVWGYIQNFKERKLAFYFVLIAGIFFGFKFTLLFSAILTAVIMYVFLKKKKRILRFFTTRQFGFFAAFIVILTLSAGKEYTLKSDQDYVNNAFNSFGDFLNFLQFKAFNDRSIIWIGGWEFLKTTNHLWPTGEPPKYFYYNSDGSIIDNVEYGIHNIGLEMMRYYGIVIGGYLTLIYLSIIALMGRIFRKAKDVYVTVFAAVIIGTAIVGGMVGQFVLMVSFSFIMFSLIGVCYSKGVFPEINLSK